MLDQVLEAYENYYNVQVAGGDLRSSITAIHRLASLFRSDFPETLAEYEETNRQLYECWKRYVGRTDPNHSRIFRTTGSTSNGSRSYSFGPYPELWIQAIWELTRFPLGWRTIVKLDTHFNEYESISIQSSPTDIYQHTIRCGPFTQALVNGLIEALGRLLRQYPAISVISVPDTYLYLNADSEFQEFVIAHRDRINLMSQHWEPFYPCKTLREQGVHINDALGDWTTGLFFYTCRAGSRHTYPTFATMGKDRVNLLNLMPTPELGPGTEEDLVEPMSISRCPCGQNRLDFRFIPHQATALRPPRGGILYDPELAERLQSKFRSLQYIQESETLWIRYRVEGEMLDNEMLEKYFSPHGFRIIWQPNDFYSVGGKRPAFYRYSG